MFCLFLYVFVCVNAKIQQNISNSDKSAVDISNLHNSSVCINMKVETQLGYKFPLHLPLYVYKIGISVYKDA